MVRQTIKEKGKRQKGVYLASLAVSSFLKKTHTFHKSLTIRTL
jgi:hypothetical protein